MIRLNSYTREFRKNLSIAYPVMLGQLGHVLVGLADNVMVGQLGAAPLAAVSLGNSLVFIALSLGIGFSFAITPLIAEADGAEQGARRGDHKRFWRDGGLEEGAHDKGCRSIRQRLGVAGVGGR